MAEQVAIAEAEGHGLLSVGEVAAFLGLSTSATKRIPASELPYSRIGSRGDRRYSKTDVAAYVERRRVAS